MQRAFSSASRASVLHSGASTRASLARTRPALSAGLGLQQQRFAHKVRCYPDCYEISREHDESIFTRGIALAVACVDVRS